MSTSRWMLLLSLGYAAAGESTSGILGQPLEVRQKNVLRITRATCEECMSLEDFYQAHRLNWLLFYAPDLRGHNHYKASVFTAFHEVCEKIRWSKITCGVVDLMQDEEYGSRYIDVKTAPAHIAVREGLPIRMKKNHVEKLLSRPGDVETLLWHLRDTIEPKEETGSLDISLEVSSPQALERLLKQHQIVVAAAPSSKAGREAYRAHVQQLVLQGLVKDHLPVQTKVKGKKAKLEEKRRSHIVFAVLTKAFDQVAQDQVVGFLDGVPTAPLSLQLPSSKESSLESVTKALKEVLQKVEKSLDAGKAASTEL